MDVNVRPMTYWMYRSYIRVLYFLFLLPPSGKKREKKRMQVAFIVTSSSLPLYNHSSHGADYSQDHLTLHIIHCSFPPSGESTVEMTRINWYSHNVVLNVAVVLYVRWWSHLSGCQMG